MNYRLNNKTVSIAIVRTYIAGNTLGVVYTINGARCATLVGKVAAGYSSPKAFRNGKLWTADAASIAALLGATPELVSPKQAAEAIEAAGYSAKTWSHPSKYEVRVYVRQAGKDRGYLAFDSADQRWDIEAGMAWGHAEKFAAIAGIAA